MTGRRRRPWTPVKATLVFATALLGAGGCSSAEFPEPVVVSALTGAGRPSSAWVMDDPEDPASFSARFVTGDEASRTGSDVSTRVDDDAVVWMSPADEPTAVRVSWRRELTGSDSDRVCRELAQWLEAKVNRLGVPIRPAETQAACASPDLADVAPGSAASDIVDSAKSGFVTPPGGREGRYAVSVLSLSQRSDTGAATRRELYVSIGFEVGGG